MSTREFKDLIDLPVVSNAAARAVGKVSEVLFNPSVHALYGVVVTPEEEGGPKLLIPLRGIRTIGKDAITIESLNVAEVFEDNAIAVEISAGGGHLNGMDVMTESGQSIGKVDKITINDDGTVASYHSTTGFFGSKHDIEPSEVKTGSKDMLVISDTARDGPAKNVTA